MASLSSTQRHTLHEQPNIPAFFLPPDIFSSNAYLVAWDYSDPLRCVYTLASNWVCVCASFWSVMSFCERYVRGRWGYLAGSYVKGNGAPERHLADNHESLKWMGHGKTLRQFTDLAAHARTHNQHRIIQRNQALEDLKYTTSPKVCGQPLLINGFGYFSFNR